jgi:hypothetical protein
VQVEEEVGPGAELAAAEDVVDQAIDDAEADVEGAQDALVDMAAALGMEVIPAEEEVGVEEMPGMPPVEEVGVEEARLREAIRKEILAVLGESQSTRDEEAIAHIRQTKSIAAADRWASGRVHSNKKNKVSIRGIGGSLAFGGPGFM